MTTEETETQVAQATGRRTMQEERRLNLILQYIAMVLLAAFFLFPLAYMYVSSLKPDNVVLADSDSLAAFVPSPTVGLENYQDAIVEIHTP